jgi:DNA polymerase I
LTAPELPAWALAIATPNVLRSVDYETHRIQPGLGAPPLVCGSVGWWDGERIHGVLLDKVAAVDAMIGVLEDPRLILSNLNIAFDLAIAANESQKRGRDILPLIFAAFKEGRIVDPAIIEALHAIANGHLLKDPRTHKPLRDPMTGEAKVGYRQSVVVDLVLARIDAKVNARWRESYALLEDVPIPLWPEDARQYPIDDTRNMLETTLAQVGVLPNVGKHEWSAATGVCLQCGARANDPRDPAPQWCVSRWPRRNLHDVQAQTFAAFCLQLGALWGVRTDPAAIEFLSDAVNALGSAGVQPFIDAGFLRAKVKKRPNDLSEDQGVVKRAVALAYGVDPDKPCPVCAGTSKVKSSVSGNPIQCTKCNATGLVLEGTLVPMTEASDKFPFGQVQIGRDILIESGDEFLMSYGESQEDEKLPSTYIPWMRDGTHIPIVLRPNAILETGRVSYSGPIQLLPRGVSAKLAEELKRRADQYAGEHALLGVRDCFVPRPGWRYYSNDYGGGELVTFSESCVLRVGFSDMGRALNEGLDVHSALGATMMGVDYATFLAMLNGDHGPVKKKLAKAYRQAAKPANFGFPGGMGPVKMVLQQRKQGPDTPCPAGPVEVWDGEAWVRGYKGLRFCVLVDGAEACGVVKVTEWKGRQYTPTCKHCIEIAERIKGQWLRQWREAKPYLDWHARNVDTVGEVVQHYSGRIRGGTYFNSEANGDFQGMLADIAKRAQCRVSEEQYVRTVVRSETGAIWCPVASEYEGSVSPLFGSRSIGFFHDELFGEAPIGIAPDVSMRVNEIMIEEFRKACPNHWRACKAAPTVMSRWWKAAEEVWHYTADGRKVLAEWHPKHDKKKCVDCRRPEQRATA